MFVCLQEFAASLSMYDVLWIDRIWLFVRLLSGPDSVLTMGCGCQESRLRSHHTYILPFASALVLLPCCNCVRPAITALQAIDEFGDVEVRDAPPDSAFRTGVCVCGSAVVGVHRTHNIL